MEEAKRSDKPQKGKKFVSRIKECYNLGTMKDLVIIREEKNYNEIIFNFISRNIRKCLNYLRLWKISSSKR